MLPSSRTFLLFQLNSLVDEEKHVGVTKADMLDAINTRTVDKLLTSLSKYFDLSIFRPDDWQLLYDEWDNMANAVDARRKFGVEKNGICLLTAYVIEGIQRLRHQEH